MFGPPLPGPTHPYVGVTGEQAKEINGRHAGARGCPRARLKRAWAERTLLCRDVLRVALRLAAVKLQRASAISALRAQSRPASTSLTTKWPRSTGAASAISGVLARAL